MTAHTEKTARPAFNEQLVKALSHPLRQHILEVLNERVASPSEIAEQTGAKVADVSYHVAKLRELGAIELVRTEPRRGVTKHFYRATSRAMLDDDQFGTLPLTVRRALFGRTLEQIHQDITDAAKGGGFDRADAHVSWTKFALDDEGYEAMTRLVEETLHRALAIQADVVSRRAADGSNGDDDARTELILLHFLRNGDAAAETA